MQCVILAAGRGTRMKELTENTPKPMITVLGRPLLEHKIEMLPDFVDEVILVVGYLGNKIREHFGSEWKGRKILYREQKQLNGTGIAILAARELLDGKFLLTMGDDLYGTEDLGRLAAHDLAILAYDPEIPVVAGFLREDAERNLLAVTERVLKPERGLVNTGAYVLDERIFFETPIRVSQTEFGLPQPIAALAETQLTRMNETEFGLPQTLAALSREHPVRVERAESWLQVGRPEDLLRAEDFLKQKKNG